MCGELLLFLNQNSWFPFLNFAFNTMMNTIAAFARGSKAQFDVIMSQIF